MISLTKRAGLTLVAMFALALATPVAATAQEELAPEHLALARRYIDLTDKSSIYEVALVQTAAQTMNTILQANPQIVEPVDKAITAALEIYKGRKGDLLDLFARNYALVFSQEELQEIVDFYGSPTGQKLASANSSINESQQMVMNVFQRNLYTEFLAAVRAELKAMDPPIIF